MSNFMSAIQKQNDKEARKIKEFENLPVTATQRNIIAGSIGLGGLILFSMFAAQIITGIFAGILTVITGIGGYFSLKLLKTADPLIKQKFKNITIKKMIEEARKNAVVQLKNQVLKNTTRLKKARDARDKIGGMIKNLKSSINHANKGKATYEKKVSMLETVEKAYKQIKENLEKGAIANKEFEEKVLEYEDLEKFTSGFNEILTAIGDSSGMDVDEMLSLAAFEHIEDNFNVALTAIENKANDMSLDI